MTNILQEIIFHKELEIAHLDGSALRRAAEAAPAPRDFRAAVTLGNSNLPPHLIAELKLASPSRGLLAPGLNSRQVAQVYAENGASAISVLTDTRYFLGKLDTLRELRFTDRCPLPLLRKDFILAESQLYESRANGADAVLLIVAAFNDDARLAALHGQARELGMTALVEIHNEPEAERAMKLKGLDLIGINNRNLSTFDVYLATTERLRPMLPTGIPVISESGIATAADVERVAAANVDAILVGEALVTAPDSAARVRELAGLEVKNYD